MLYTRLQSIICREQRAFIVDHVALATLFFVIGGVLVALVR